MKLKAPEGVGDPCVAGAIVASRDGVYEVTSEVGALLIECFGFVEITAAEHPRALSAPRRSRPARKKPRA